jgi:predicted transport protein
MALVDPTAAALPAEPSTRIQENHQFFLEQLRAPATDLAVVCRGISKLLVVDVALSRDQDNPQLIFESMNSTGRELSQADLIRNYVLMGQPPELQERLYTLHWRPMEQSFGQEAYSGNEFSAFMRDFLTLKTAEVPRLDLVYEVFKQYERQPAVAEAGIEALLRDLHTTAIRYCRVALGQEPDPQLKDAVHDLRELKVNVVTPLLLELYGDHQTGLLSRNQLLEALRLLEAYVFRRAVCAIPSNSQQKTFATFSKALRREPGHYLPSFKAQLLDLPSYRRFPSDEEFRREVQIRNLYKFNKSCSYWLRRLENQQRKEPITVADYTIEHILPQNPDLSAAWREALGPDWAQVQEEWLHRLGNLTLTGSNPELSDRPFLDKRDHQEGGFRTSPLRLNQGLGQLERWDGDAIRQRGETLAARALEVWTAPELSEEQRQFYRQPRRRQDAGYTLDDHPQLANPQIRAVFDGLDARIRALDPNVSQEVRKLYIAYKAETNFVDIVPQTKRLRLSLNMPFAELNDPRGLAKNVAGIGRWGNGEVEIGVATLEEVPYALGLIRQSLERQLEGEW